MCLAIILKRKKKKTEKREIHLRWFVDIQWIPTITLLRRGVCMQGFCMNSNNNTVNCSLKFYFTLIYFYFTSDLTFHFTLFHPGWIQTGPKKKGRPRIWMKLVRQYEEVQHIRGLGPRWSRMAKWNSYI